MITIVNYRCGLAIGQQFPQPIGAGYQQAPNSIYQSTMWVVPSTMPSKMMTASINQAVSSLQKNFLYRWRCRVIRVVLATWQRVGCRSRRQYCGEISGQSGHLVARYRGAPADHPMDAIGPTFFRSAGAPQSHQACDKFRSVAALGPFPALLEKHRLMRGLVRSLPEPTETAPMMTTTAK